jgi:peptidoglycan/LPS O-acetylase OafA/YrhL
MNFVDKLLPEKGKNLGYLDAIRGVAVLFVLFRHAWGLSWSPSAQLGPLKVERFIIMMSSGVDLFFVLSGVLLSITFIRADAMNQVAPSFKRYFTARVMRIGPPYWIVLFLVVVLYTPVHIPQEKVWSEVGGATFLAHLLFAQSLFVFSFGAYPVGTPFWTLTVEMVFYLSLPVLVRVFYNGRWWQGVVGAFVVSGVWLYLCRYSLQPLVSFINEHSFGIKFPQEGIRFFLSHQILGYLPHFAIGISISTILQRKKTSIFESPTAGLIYLLLGFVFLLVAMYALGGISIKQGYTNPMLYFQSEGSQALIYYFLESFPFAIAYGMIILGAALAAPGVRSFLAAIPGLRLFGVLGYSVYLIHMPLIYTFNSHWWIAADVRPWWHLAKIMSVGLLVITAFSLALFYAIERPCMVLASKQKNR